MQMIYTVLQLWTGSWSNKFLVHAMAACLGSLHREHMCSPCRGLLLSLQDPQTEATWYRTLVHLYQSSLMDGQPNATTHAHHSAFSISTHLQTIPIFGH